MWHWEEVVVGLLVLHGGLPLLDCPVGHEVHQLRQHNQAQHLPGTLAKSCARSLFKASAQLGDLVDGHDVDMAGLNKVVDDTLTDRALGRSHPVTHGANNLLHVSELALEVTLAVFVVH